MLLSLPVEVLVEQATSYVKSLIDDPDVGEEVGRRVGAAVGSIPRGGWARSAVAFAERGSEFRAYAVDPTARDLTMAFLDHLVAPDSRIDGVEHLDAAVARAAGGERVLIVGNHTSYADTTTAVNLLFKSGRAAAADRIAVLAGPKVFSDPFRRFASATVTAIKVAQSNRLAHNTADLSLRDIAKIARRCLNIAADLMDSGKMVLVYAEGTRSRDGRLQPFLRATGRYACLPDTAILPLSQTGANIVMPVGASTFRRAAVRLRFSPLIEPTKRTRLEVLETIHRAIEAGLPPTHRPPPDAPRIY
jgi:1-acyl-sn-glycerol-3-phosphate acyltransferase